jgi:hypothetical protein
VVVLQSMSLVEHSAMSTIVTQQLPQMIGVPRNPANSGGFVAAGATRVAALDLGISSSRSKPPHPTDFDQAINDHNSGAGSPGILGSLNMQIVLALVLLVLLPSVASAEARIALLIGNNGYSAKVGPLKNPHSDILLVGAALKAVGFNVTEIKDADYRSTEAAIKRHIAAVRREGQGAISFVYYSGHGAADPNTKINYLIPVDVANADDEELWNYSINLNTLVENLRAQAAGATHYVVFDACRNELNLTRKGQKALTEKGFVPMAYAPGVMIAYATAPGGTASDRGAGGGTYAKALAEEVMKPGVDSMLVFTRVARRVQQEIGQDPFLSASTMPEIYFAGSNPAPQPQPPGRSELERAWVFIKETHDQAQLEAFIREFADTPYAEMARARLEELKKSPAGPSEGSSTSSSGDRGWLGVKIQNIDAGIAARLGLAAPKGALVTEITTPGPAAEADLRADDAIISVNGRAVTDSRDLAQQIASLSSDAKVKLGIFRNGNETAVFVKLGKIPSGGSAKTEPSLGSARFNGKWRVVFTFNERCVASSGQDVGYWTINNGTVIGRLNGDHGTVSSDGEVHIRLRSERIFAVRAQLNGSQGRGTFQIEGHRCGGTVNIQRL